MNFVTATRTDGPQARVYLTNMGEYENGKAAAVELRNGHAFGLPTVIDCSVGKWECNYIPPHDPSGSLEALVRLAGESRQRVEAFNRASAKEQQAITNARLRYSEHERKQRAARGRVPQCDFKPSAEDVKWIAAKLWDSWNARGLHRGERAREAQEATGKAVLPTRTFNAICQRLGLKIVKKNSDAD